MNLKFRFYSLDYFIKSLFFFTFLIFIRCGKEKIEVFDFKKKISKDSVYIFTRGTDTKQGYFANKFNIKDTLSSHLGLAIYTKDEWKVYHVIETKDNLSDFREDDIKVFFDVEKEKIYYMSIWLIKNLNFNEKNLLKKNLLKKKEYHIKFDKYFKLKDSLKLYCSQLVFESLSKVDKRKFKFDLHKRELKGIFKTYFQKDTLVYYPVDGFQEFRNFKKIYTWYK